MDKLFDLLLITINAAGPEFRENPSGAALPVVNEIPRSRSKKNVTKQVEVPAVEPSDKEITGRLVRGAGVPEGVQHIAGHHYLLGKGPDQIWKTRRDGRTGWIGVFHTCELEQIDPFGDRQVEGRGNARQRCRRAGDLPALFEPGIPGCTDAAELGDFFTSQALCPAASRRRAKTDVVWRQGIATTAQEGAEGAVLFWGKAHDGNFYTGIK